MTPPPPQLPAALRPVSRQRFLLSALLLLVVPNALFLWTMWWRLEHEFAPSVVRTCTEVTEKRGRGVRLELESGESPVLLRHPCVPVGARVEKRRWEYGYRVDGGAPSEVRWPLFAFVNLLTLLFVGMGVVARRRRREGSKAAPAGPFVPTSVRAQVHSLPHRVRIHRVYALVLAGLLTLCAIPVVVLVVWSTQLQVAHRLILVLVFLLYAGGVTLATFSQTYTLTPDALVRFLLLPGRTVRYADLVHAEVHRVYGRPMLALQRREGSLVELSMGTVDPGELLFTLETLAERAPTIVLGPEALRLREQARGPQ
jgi:hypothetical protein